VVGYLIELVGDAGAAGHGDGGGCDGDRVGGGVGTVVGDDGGADDRGTVKVDGAWCAAL
jgi:hypothetical protein